MDEIKEQKRHISRLEDRIHDLKEDLQGALERLAEMEATTLPAPPQSAAGDPSTGQETPIQQLGRVIDENKDVFTRLRDA